MPEPRPKEDLRSKTPAELADIIRSLGAQPFRAKQLFSWLQKGVTSLERMTDLPASLKTALSERCFISFCAAEKVFVSADGTRKFLFSLHDGETIESALLRYRHGNTLCVSSQVGCKMGCGFCATGMCGFARDLLPGEMLGQISAAGEHSGLKISNAVLMGMGEPLDNFDNVARFLELIALPGENQIGARHISLSTCGVVPGIYRLLELRSQITLSVSLHAPNDEIRGALMPVNKRWGVDELLEACRAYIKATNRRISFEYALMAGVNDSGACAGELSRKLRGMLCHVNLIPANPVRGSAYATSGTVDIRRFSEILRQNGINATLRRTLGADIRA